VNIWRNKWFSLASIATISACLFLFGLFYAILTNFQHIVKTAEEGVSITVFFDEDIDDIRLQEIGEMISKRVEVREVKFKSDEEVWEEFQGDYIPEEYRDGFAENPLEGSKNYEIYLSDVSMQSALVTWLESVEGVRQVNRSEITANALGGINVLIGYVSLGIIIILLAVSVFLISNTVMIGISVRKEEINIMKYIGATDFFVRSPFVIEGILIGLLGSVVPLVSIYYLYTNIIVYIGEKFQILSGLLNFLPVEMIFSTLLPVSVGIGVGIGFLGSIVTVRKHLKV
jgi:cell division transport system permease protein